MSPNSRITEFSLRLTHCGQEPAVKEAPIKREVDCD